MFRLLLILGFIVSVGVNPLAGVNPHLESDATCSTSCCRAARQKAQESVASSLCCLFDCKQSGESHSSASQIVAPQKKDSVAARVVFKAEAGLSTTHKRFPNSPTRNIDDSSDIYLETGSLLL
jgi:hypothetical protein